MNCALTPAAQAFREMLVADALRAGETAARSQLRIAGVDLAFDIADPDIAAALLPALRHHVRSVGGRELPLTRLIIWSSPLDPFPWNSRHLGRGGAIEGFSHGSVRAVAAADESSLVLWDDERQLACCWFAGVSGVTRWDRAAPLRTALHFALASPARQLVHGAVVGAGGRGALLAGPGGSGKSTTTLACLQAGMHVIGDDYAVVELVGRRAWNLYGSIKVGEREPGPHGRDDRRTLILGHDLPGTPSESLELVALLLPRVVGGSRSSLSIASPAAALRALAPSTLIQAPYEDRPSLGILADLARAVPAYHLNLGDDRGVPAIREVVAV
jgi:hypothetical protein